MSRARWYEDPIAMGALVLGAGGLLYLARRRVTDVFVRGKKLSSSTLSEDGTILESPSVLAMLASGVYRQPIAPEVYSLARMIRSEGAAEGEVRGHVAMNDLRDLGWQSLQFLLTYSTADWSRGKYGKQHSVRSDGQKQTRRYSTARDPYEGDVKMALKVLSDHSSGYDPTGGAVKFLDREAMASQLGSQGFDAVNARWTSEGLVPYTLPQYGDDLVLYRRA